MANIAAIVAKAVDMSKSVEGEHIRRASLVDKGEPAEMERFVHRLARMIATGAPFVQVPMPQGCSGRFHVVSGVTVREIVTYDYQSDAHFARFDAALQL